jgi:hypothetical protein
MKKVVISVFLIFAAAAASNLIAQRVPAGAGTPAGGGDRNLAGDDIKARSIEIERMRQEAVRSEAATFAPINKDISVKFPQIKEDFEGIQIMEAAIIKAYTTGKLIDYNLIEISADGILKRGKRLDANLFAPEAETKTEPPADAKSNEKADKPKSTRDLIVALDTAIGSFVSSKIFGNIKVIEPEVAIKTRKDLLDVLALSEKLSAQAKLAKVLK